jgi:hypothetical protein
MFNYSDKIPEKIKLKGGYIYIGSVSEVSDMVT